LLQGVAGERPDQHDQPGRHERDHHPAGHVATLGVRGQRGPAPSEASHVGVLPCHVDAVTAVAGRVACARPVLHPTAVVSRGDGGPVPAVARGTGRRGARTGDAGRLPGATAPPSAISPPPGPGGTNYRRRRGCATPRGGRLWTHEPDDGVGPVPTPSSGRSCSRQATAAAGSRRRATTPASASMTTPASTQAPSVSPAPRPPAPPK